MSEGRLPLWVHMSADDDYLDAPPPKRSLTPRETAHAVRVAATRGAVNEAAESARSAAGGDVAPPVRPDDSTQ